MRDKDLADSDLASHRDLPSDHVDSLADFLFEAFANWQEDWPANPEEMLALVKELIAEGVGEAQRAGVIDRPTSSKSNAVVQGLQVLASMKSWRIAGPAIIYLRLSGHEGRSFAQIGRAFGKCRQAVQYLHRLIQKEHPGLRSRGDKPEIRESCRKRRLGKRKPAVEWRAKSIWKNQISRHCPTESRHPQLPG